MSETPLVSPTEVDEDTQGAMVILDAVLSLPSSPQAAMPPPPAQPQAWTIHDDLTELLAAKAKEQGITVDQIVARVLRNSVLSATSPEVVYPPKHHTVAAAAQSPKQSPALPAQVTPTTARHQRPRACPPPPGSKPAAVLGIPPPPTAKDTFTRRKPSKKATKTTGNGSGALWLLACAALLASVLVAANHYQMFAVGGRDGPAYRLLPLTLDHPAKRCIEISKDALSTMHATGQWEDMSKSMESYLVDGGLDAISAFRVGMPYCYVLTRTAANQTLHLVNPRVIGRSLDSVSRKEVSTSCPDKPRWMERADVVWLRYDDATLDTKLERSFDGATSYGMQAEIIYSAGKTICDNSDEGVETLAALVRRGMHAESA